MCVRVDEHYFQNFVQRKFSPNAKPHVLRYIAELEKMEEKIVSGEVVCEVQIMRDDWLTSVVHR